MIKDFIADITTETSVTLEFMNRKVRNSVTGSISNIVKKEEVSEFIDYTFPTHTSDRHTDIEARTLSSTSDRLIDDR